MVALRTYATAALRGCKTLAAFALVAALCAMGMPATAAAVEDWHGSTAIVITATNPGQISVSAPTAMPLPLRADGSVVEGTALELRNLSTTSVAVSNVRVGERNGARVKGLTTATEGSNELRALFAPAGVQGLDAATCLDGGASPPDQASWTVAPGETLAVGVQGSFKNPSATFSSTYAHAAPVTACTITWTVASC